MQENIKVLIVEDKAITAMHLAQIVRGTGLKLLTVLKSGEEVLDYLINSRPDIILMDVMLRGYYTGIDIAEIISQKYSVPLIFITALNDDETVLHALRTKPAGFIVKPFQNCEVENILKSVIESLRNRTLCDYEFSNGKI